MSCSGCTTDKETGKPGGCKSNGTCGTSGCNKLNTFDWLRSYDIKDVEETDLVEVSFKNGTRKEFFHNPVNIQAVTGDYVVVDTGSGWNVGQISLSGDLVLLQMKKKSLRKDYQFYNVQRIAREEELDKLRQARALEKDVMIRARAIAKSLGLDMKIGEVEFQADQRKAIFYFISPGRVDFRELIKAYAREFKIKIEMKQIGSRQESALIGGLGPCGRELCCSTWLTNFKSVTTAAARYQNLAINQVKLSGQCGKLKCCLNYELDMYIEELEKYPTRIKSIRTKEGKANYIKTDIFKELMYFSLTDNLGRHKIIAFHPDRVNFILAENKKGNSPDNFGNVIVTAPAVEDEENIDFEEDLTGIIELPAEKKRRGGRGSRNNRNKRKPGRNSNSNKGSGNKNRGSKKPAANASNSEKPKKKRPQRRKPRNPKKQENKDQK